MPCPPCNNTCRQGRDCPADRPAAAPNDLDGEALDRDEMRFVRRIAAVGIAIWIAGLVLAVRSCS
jgi:hypothetical protein